MEEKIKRAASRVKMSFVYFWLLPVFLVIFGETGGAWVGLYAGDVRAAYFAETITILLSALSVPASLKLFSWVLVRKIELSPSPMHCVCMCCGVGCVWLCLPYRWWRDSSLIIWYLSNKGVLCALIALTASLFCLPEKKRLREELHIDKEQ